MVNKIDWNKQLTVPVREIKEAQAKHLVVKSLLTFLVKLKYSRNLSWQRIYPEFDLDGAIPDLYHEDLKSKAVYIYEIQKQVSKEWIDKKNKFYENYEVYNFKTVDWILIDLNKCPDKINEILVWLKEQIR